MIARVGCAVLAAGGSRRLGHPKQLVLHRGQPLVRLAALCAWQSRAAGCALVVGAAAEPVRAALGALPFEILPNGQWTEGVAASLRVAANWAHDAGYDALLVALCDQPRLTPAHLNRLIAEHERTSLAVASRYAGKNAVPALFPKAHFKALGELRGDFGARALLNGSCPVVSVPWADGELDVDTADSERLLLDASID